MIGNHHTERRRQTGYLYGGVDALSPESYLRAAPVPISGAPTLVPWLPQSHDAAANFGAMCSCMAPVRAGSSRPSRAARPSRPVPYAYSVG